MSSGMGTDIQLQESIACAKDQLNRVMCSDLSNLISGYLLERPAILIIKKGTNMHHLYDLDKETLLLTHTDLRHYYTVCIDYMSHSIAYIFCGDKWCDGKVIRHSVRIQDHEKYRYSNPDRPKLFDIASKVLSEHYDIRLHSIIDETKA